jgi:hypothetical protein
MPMVFNLGYTRHLRRCAKTSYIIKKKQKTKEIPEPTLILELIKIHPLIVVPTCQEKHKSPH